MKLNWIQSNYFIVTKKQEVCCIFSLFFDKTNWRKFCERYSHQHETDCCRCHVSNILAIDWNNLVTGADAQFFIIKLESKIWGDCPRPCFYHICDPKLDLTDFWNPFPYRHGPETIEIQFAYFAISIINVSTLIVPIFLGRVIIPFFYFLESGLFWKQLWLNTF